jgi:hypothetical protein
MNEEQYQLEQMQWSFIRKIADGTLNPWMSSDITRKRKRIRDWVLDKLDESDWLSDQHNISVLLSAADKLRLFPSHLESFYIEKHRQMVHDKSHAGTICTVCDRHVKVYKRAFNSNMATFLKSLIINSLKDTMIGGDGFIHHSDCLYTGRDYTCIQYWNLAETYLDKDGNKKMSGKWKPTDVSMDFFKGELTIPKYVFTLNGKVIKKSEEQISFQEALGIPFNYKELMQVALNQ